MKLEFTILGEPASKANSRQIVTIAGRPSSIKSAKARGYEANALRQIPPRYRLRLEGPVRVTLRVFYATQRPDLDESVILDCLQDRYGKPPKDVLQGAAAKGVAISPRVLIQAGVYRNDRQVRERHVYHGIDRKNPRAEIVIETMEAQQQELAA